MDQKAQSEVCFIQLHARLGLDRAADQQKGGLFSGASPLSPTTAAYFCSLDLPVMDTQIFLLQ